MGNWYQTDDVKMTLVQAPLVDGQATSNSDEVDMQGFDGVMFVGILGTISGSGTVSMTAGQDTTSGGSFTELPTAVASAVAADDEQFMVVDILRPAKRFLRTVLVRAVDNNVYGGTLAIQYKARAKPTVQEATGAAGEIIAAGITQVTTPSE